MMAFKGKLTAAKAGYAGHNVELLAIFKSDSLEEPFSLRLLADVSDDGQFNIEPTSGLSPVGDITLTVRSPEGVRLYEETRPVRDELIVLDVPPSKPVGLEIKPDPLAESMGPFAIRITLHNRTINAPAGNKLVSVWGKLPDSAMPRTILAADYTDISGVVKLEFPRQRYQTLELEIPGALSGVAHHDVPTDTDGVPASNIPITEAFEEEPIDPDQPVPCSCNVTTPPRTPQHEDLVESENLYSTDLADGTCPSPAVANRTLEEYRYYSLIRTTDPYLVNVKPKTGVPLSDLALGTLAELSYGLGSMDSLLSPVTSPEFDTSVTGVRDKSAGTPITLNQARQSSDSYYTSGVITARAWSGTASIDTISEELVNRASSFSEDALRHALADPDGFTPVSLMTAERYAAIDKVTNDLQLYYDASKGRELVSTDNMPEWDSAKMGYQAATIAHGHVLEWRQVWRADGYSLGDLLYSLPLAPGQKRKVSVLDWDRRESNFRNETRSFNESFAANLTRDRTVTEVVNSVVNESIDAGSSANTWAAGGGIGLGIPFSGGFFGLGVAGGGGGASSTAWQNSARSLSASSGQQLNDRTNQASSAVRSQRATVVVGAQQSEGLSITSEVVANYNHCHAMTMEYFEVLQHYRVDQELAAVRECLFIPLGMRPFNIYKALRWRDILKRRLRERKWSGGFEAIERILRGYVDTGYPPGRFADEIVTELSGELRLQLSIARPRDLREDEDIDDYLDTAWDFWGDLFGSSSAKKAYDATIEDRATADTLFANEYAPRAARGFCEGLTLTLVVEDAFGIQSDREIECDFTMVSNYRPGGLHLVSFRATSFPTDITRTMIRAVKIGSSLNELTPNSTTELRMASIQYATSYRQHRLVPTRWMRNDVLDGDDALISTRTLTRSEELNPREEDRDLMSGLIKHLNEFVEHYHQIIWWRMDPNRRFMLLDGFIAPGSGGRSLASVVENRLLSIVGNALVMPVAPGYALDPLIKNSLSDDEPIDLLELYRPPIPFAPKRVSLPTRGVHAEAILGECNSCEIRDDTRFWDWAAEPIPNNEPTPIAETGTGSRRQEPADTTPSDLAAPIVAIQNAPAAPAPTSISALTTLLGKENLFKDLTGLEQNQLNALAGFQQSLKTASAFGKMAASGAKAAFANRSGDSIMRKVQEAEAGGLLETDDAKLVVRKLFSVMNGEVSDSDTPLAQETVVDKALEAVNAATGEKSIKVSSRSGSTSQTVETNTPGDQPVTTPDIDFKIEGIPPLRQPSPLSCWAVSLTMLLSHERQQSITVETALLEGGQEYVDRFRSDSGLPVQEVTKLQQDFDLKDVSFGALNAGGIDAALRHHGPLWIIADEDSSPGFSVHARVITGIIGDGTANGTTIIYNDPALGQETRETLKVLIDKLDQLSKGMQTAFGGVSPTILAR